MRSSAMLVLAALAGCGGAASSRPAGDIRSALPPPLVTSLPDDLEVCFDEASDVPATYRLWMVRAPGRRWIEPPDDFRPAHVHQLPERILRGMFEAKAPGTDLGPPQEPRGRFSHWSLGGTEIQIREVIAENGWFASVECFKPDGEAGEESPRAATGRPVRRPRPRPGH